jgi:hypothetical protein
VCHKDPDSIMTSTFLWVLLLAVVSPLLRSAGVFMERGQKPTRSRFEELGGVSCVLAERWTYSGAFIVLKRRTDRQTRDWVVVKCFVIFGHTNFFLLYCSIVLL